MKALTLILLGVLITGCTITDRGVRVDFPTSPNANICLNAISDDEMVTIRSKVINETFEDEKLKRAKFHTKNRCVLARQVITMMGVFTFADDQLEIAKFLYTKTDDKHNYDIVIDELTYARDKDELRNFIESM